MIRGAILGAVLVLVLGAAIGYAGIVNGWMPANADAKPSNLERWMAHSSLRATLHRDAPKTDNPLPLTDANLETGIKLYARNCAICHGGPSGEPTNVARGLYQKPPQLATDGVEDDPDGITYWKIDHGIRLTGMPAFGAALGDDKVWALVLFLKHMDGLPAAPKRAWEAVKT